MKYYNYTRNEILIYSESDFVDLICIKDGKTDTWKAKGVVKNSIPITVPPSGKTCTVNTTLELVETLPDGTPVYTEVLEGVTELPELPEEGDIAIVPLKVLKALKSLGSQATPKQVRAVHRVVLTLDEPSTIIGCIGLLK